MRVGQALGGRLDAGDVLLLAGHLGAGKTTLTRGIGDGLGVRGPVTSPTFVLSRVHPPATGTVALVHVDAYRLTGWEELEDLDLGVTTESAVTVVEWGRGLGEPLSDSYLEVDIRRSTGTAAPDDGGVAAEADGQREIEVRGTGSRWPPSRVAALWAALVQALGGEA